MTTQNLSSKRVEIEMSPSQYARSVQSWDRLVHSPFGTLDHGRAILARLVERPVGFHLLGLHGFDVEVLLLWWGRLSVEYPFHLAGLQCFVDRA